jgi:ribonuclease HI
MAKSMKKYYAVKKGRKPGIYHKWKGQNGAEVQVKRFSGADHKAFTSKSKAKKYLETEDKRKVSSHSGKIVIFTDGACIDNPGPGGYGIVLIDGKKKKELSGGFRYTTNNRMELIACLFGLKELERKSSVVIYSDSKYVVDGYSKGWAKKWKANNWMRDETEPAQNVDLWEQLLELCEKNDVQFQWVKGHSGNPENERCDELATEAASQDDLPADELYEGN